MSKTAADYLGLWIGPTCGECAKYRAHPRS